MWQAQDNGTDIQHLEAFRPHGLPARETDVQGGGTSAQVSIRLPVGDNRLSMGLDKGDNPPVLFKGLIKTMT